MRSTGPFTEADAILVAGFAAGAWWSTGGPTWAAILSIVAEQTALHMESLEPRPEAKEEAQQEAWNADTALTPLTLVRLGEAMGQPHLPFAAPLAIVLHDKALAQGLVPNVGGTRALIMLATIVLEHAKKRRASAAAPRLNPTTPRAARRRR